MSKRVSSLLHWCDQYIGIPIIFLLGKLRKKKICPKLIQHIGVLNTAAIGDTVLLSGVIADLRAAYPSATLVFFTGPSNYEAALLIPGIQVVKLPVTAIFKSVSMIRSYIFDLWVDFGQWPRINALYSYCAHADYKVGFETPGQFRHYIYDLAVLHGRVHELDNYRRLVGALEIEAYHPPCLFLAPNAKKALPKTIALHLYAGGSRAFLKEWPDDKWVQLINYLIERGFNLILTGAPADRPRCKSVIKLCSSPGKIEIVAGKTSLKETATLLKNVRAVISIDTGVMHLAAALGCPTLALHGPTSPQRWGGVGAKVIAITPDTIYAPCIHLGFEKTCSESRCMKAISVPQVIAGFEKLELSEVL